MRRLLCLALLLFAAPTFAADMVRLQGEYRWSEGQADGPLSATFTPLEIGTWKVAFSFRFNGQPHLYTGTATGQLDDGSLSGTVQNEKESRTFTFSGKVQDGKFEGIHSELRRGSERQTGTLALAP